LAIIYPRARFMVEQTSVPGNLSLLRERRVDILVTRVVSEDPDIDHKTLLHERILVVCGAASRWARLRRPMKVADLADAPRVQSPSMIAPGVPFHEAFAARGLPVPQVRVVTNSLNLCDKLIEGGNFLMMLPHPVPMLGVQRADLRVLPVEPLQWQFPTTVATRRGRTIPPLASLFIAELRRVAAGLAEHRCLPRQGVEFRGRARRITPRTGSPTGTGLPLRRIATRPSRASAIAASRIGCMSRRHTFSSFPARARATSEGQMLFSAPRSAQRRRRASVSVARSMLIP
jgi:hypothetical protein